METILLRYYSMELFFRCIMVVMAAVVFIVCLIRLLCEFYPAWREKHRKAKEQAAQAGGENGSRTDNLSPMLGNIEDGRFYKITSPNISGTTIACVKHYDAKARRLYCHAYLWIGKEGTHNLRIDDPLGVFGFRRLPGDKPLRMDFENSPNVIMWGGETLSSYLTDEDFNDFVRCLFMAGFKWNIAQGKKQIFGGRTYRLKETKK